MNFFIVTNNQAVKEALQNQCEVTLLETNYRGVLTAVRDFVHQGHRLLSHPLSGSVKPNETPFKSVLLSKQKGALDQQSLSIIESAVITCDKFGENRFILTENLKTDFALIDLSLISGALPQ